MVNKIIPTSLDRVKRKKKRGVPKIFSFHSTPPFFHCPARLATLPWKKVTRFFEAFFFFKENLKHSPRSWNHIQSDLLFDIVQLVCSAGTKYQIMIQDDKRKTFSKACMQPIGPLSSSLHSYGCRCHCRYENYWISIGPFALSQLCCWVEGDYSV